MAQLWSTGPVALFYGERTSGGVPFFIGHGTHAPDVHTRAFWVDVHCDVGGQAPIDRLVSGLLCTVSIELNRYSEAVVRDLEARARCALLPGEVDGGLGPGALGTLALLEGASYVLYMVFPNIVKPAFQNVPIGGGPGTPGYRFFAAMLDDTTVKPGSSKEKTINCQFTCLQVFNTGQYVLSTGPIQNAFGNGQLVVYDHNITAVNGLNWQ
jgi:hypothetical protein